MIILMLLMALFGATPLFILVAVLLIGPWYDVIFPLVVILYLLFAWFILDRDSNRVSRR